ncbi:MAG: HAD family hydrolase [Planctomycetaceae bacterium]
MNRILPVLCCLLTAESMAADPLPSWNDGAAEAAIVRFVEQVSNRDSPEYLEPSRRIAVFDNDGTLWSEQPAYFQAMFVFDRIRQMAPDHPEWKEQLPYSAVLKGDMKTALEGGESALFKMVMATHAGITSEEFDAIVRQWIETARHPKTGKLYTEMVFQPMLELLALLKANDFRVYIVSGGGVDFMRVFSERVYGIPPEQVIGSRVRTSYEMRNGQPVIIRLPEMAFIDDKAGKPLGIHEHIGRRPIFAAGNSDGDFQMLEWTTSTDDPHFGLIIHHTDSEREFAYDRNSHIGQLNKALDEASQRKWQLVDMKNDWKIIYPWSSQ